MEVVPYMQIVAVAVPQKLLHSLRFTDAVLQDAAGGWDPTKVAQG